jgi:hypothetical protein
MILKLPTCRAVKPGEVDLFGVLLVGPEARVLAIGHSADGTFLLSADQASMADYWPFLPGLILASALSGS